MRRRGIPDCARPTGCLVGRLALLAEAPIRTNGWTVTPRVLAALETAQRLDPGTGGSPWVISGPATQSLSTTD